MLKLLVPLVLLAAVAVAGAGIATERIVLPESSCPYGSKGSSRNNALNCKPRPLPGPQQTAAVEDGTALKNGVRAFQASGYGDMLLAGVGLNRWGETTFTLPTWTKQVGDVRLRPVTFDALGGMPRQTNAIRRHYVQAAADVAFPLSDADPRALARAMRRVATALPGAQFVEASYAPGFTAPGWALGYESRGTPIRLAADAAGRRVCALAGTVEGVDRCDPSALLAGGSSSGPPAIVPLGKAELARRGACMQRAGVDIAALQRCLMGEK